LSVGPGPRLGVPQATHVHSLLIRGKRSLMDLFPDLLRRLTEQGRWSSTCGTTSRSCALPAGRHARTRPNACCSAAVRFWSRRCAKIRRCAPHHRSVRGRLSAGPRERAPAAVALAATGRPPTRARRRRRRWRQWPPPTRRPRQAQAAQPWLRWRSPSGPVARVSHRVRARRKPRGSRKSHPHCDCESSVVSAPRISGKRSPGISKAWRNVK